MDSAKTTLDEEFFDAVSSPQTTLERKPSISKIAEPKVEPTHLDFAKSILPDDVATNWDNSLPPSPTLAEATASYYHQQQQPETIPEIKVSAATLGRPVNAAQGVPPQLPTLPILPIVAQDRALSLQVEHVRKSSFSQGPKSPFLLEEGAISGSTMYTDTLSIITKLEKSASVANVELVDSPNPNRIPTTMGPGPPVDLFGEDGKILIKNLDNGELVDADELFKSFQQQGGTVEMNPIAIQIFKRTGLTSGSGEASSEEEDEGFHIRDEAVEMVRGASSAAKSYQFQAVKAFGHKTKPDDGFIKVKAKHGTKTFDRLMMIQELHAPPAAPKVETDATDQAAPTSPIWVMKFSQDGKYLAAGGKDAILRVWITATARKEADVESVKTSSSSLGNAAYFRKEPWRIYKGHKSDILDISWSKNDFLLSSSMDQTVRLWHVTRLECLCIFQHSDFVTSIAFHPKDDRFFLSGCLDCRVRLWSIPEKRVQFWNELPGSALITSVQFSKSCKMCIVGSYNGSCVFFETDGLKYNTQLQIRRKKKGAVGEKVSGICAMPLFKDLNFDSDKILITSNDSRIRLYNMRDKGLYCKYKGLSNSSSQISASFSNDGHYVISGSEDHYVYIWETLPSTQPTSNSVASSIDSMTKQSAMAAVKKLNPFNYSRRDRNSSYERFQAHDSSVTCALFAPWDSADAKRPSDDRVIVTSDYNGYIRVFQNTTQ